MGSIETRDGARKLSLPCVRDRSAEGLRRGFGAPEP